MDKEKSMSISLYQTEKENTFNSLTINEETNFQSS